MAEYLVNTRNLSEFIKYLVNTRPVAEYLVNHRAGAAGGWRGWHGRCALVCAGGAAGGIADLADRALAYGRWRAAGIATVRLAA